MKNHFHFGSCRQSSNKKCIRGKQSVLLADMTIKILLKKLLGHLKMPRQYFN